MARRFRFAAALASLALLLAACGGGGGDSSPPQTQTQDPALLAAMLDSFGNVVEPAGAGDSGASGGDGSAGDGAAIANAPVRVVDSQGRSATAVTDAQGYYRVRIDGFVPPLIASVTKADGITYYSPSVQAVKVRGFITINITGLTDKVTSDVAAAFGLKSPAQLTAATLATNPATVAKAKADLATQLAAQITAAGLNPATFDPVTLPFRPNLTGYDQVLESVKVTKDANGATVITPKVTVGGSISGLGNATGLSLRNGTETIPVAAGATTFIFPTAITQGGSYSVSVATQPTGLTCTVANGSGTVGTAPVTNVAVACAAPPPTATTGNGILAGVWSQDVTYTPTGGTPTTNHFDSAAVPVDINFRAWPANPVVSTSGIYTTTCTQNSFSGPQEMMTCRTVGNDGTDSTTVYNFTRTSYVGCAVAGCPVGSVVTEDISVNFTITGTQGGFTNNNTPGSATYHYVYTRQQ